jgi:hypothetical protein
MGALWQRYQITLRIIIQRYMCVPDDNDEEYWERFSYIRSNFSEFLFFDELADSDRFQRELIKLEKNIRQMHEKYKRGKTWHKLEFEPEHNPINSVPRISRRVPVHT